MISTRKGWASRQIRSAQLMRTGIGAIGLGVAIRSTGRLRRSKYGHELCSGHHDDKSPIPEVELLGCPPEEFEVDSSCPDWPENRVLTKRGFVLGARSTLIGMDSLVARRLCITSRR